MSIAVRTLVEAMEVPYRIYGSADREVERAAPIDRADAASVTFCSRAGEAGVRLMRETGAGVVICSSESAVDEGKTFIVVDDPRLAFLRVVRRFFAEKPEPGRIHPTAVIDEGASIAPSAHIGPFVWIGAGCSVGEGSVIHAHVSLYPKTRIGSNVTVHAGTVIGADGYGYQRNERGQLEKFPHIGGVVIEDGVEIGSNTSIDRGTLGDTILREGSRIDNQVHIAHNVIVGRHAAVIANAMIGGSTTIGDGAWIAPSACVRDGLKIGANAVIGLGALVVKEVAEGETVMGAPARPAEEQKRFLAAAAKLAKGS
ncbi:MAG TPA: UDP-3-O-(3-hydroxymyristoyl)glucosamine N-acyltransferase [Thermoanaerobaculia bacterium]|jgi:UDP-3-O-[3-hydroxymyristoyl] glucosamine N-acyltransferase|nr:UDP-3-O-(3-hydroxymyristoyl)glucosamine N-acyltransferase [Thermoanaerobaculia bacterium]